MDNEVAEIAISNDVSMINKPDEVKITGIGVRLKNAREAMHLSEKEAAARLYLNPKIIFILENEAFAEGPPITFMRGYLRSYARMLNLPENEIQAGLNGLENAFPQPKSNTPVLHATPINYSDRYIHWITYLIVITLIILVSLWWNSHSKYVISDVPSTEPILNTENTETIETATPNTIPSSDAGRTANTAPQVQTTTTPVVQAGTPKPVGVTSPTVVTSPTIVPSPAGVSSPSVVTSSTGVTNATEASTKSAPSPVTNVASEQTAATAPAITATPTAERDGVVTRTNVSSKNNTGSDTPKKTKKHKKHKTVISNMAIALPD